MKTVYEIKSIDFDLKLEQRANGDFRVTYGKQIDDNLDYTRAAHAFGECLFHALACEGLLDNGE